MVQDRSIVFCLTSGLRATHHFHKEGTLGTNSSGRPRGCRAGHFFRTAECLTGDGIPGPRGPSDIISASQGVGHYQL